MGQRPNTELGGSCKLLSEDDSIVTPRIHLGPRQLSQPSGERFPSTASMYKSAFNCPLSTESVITSESTRSHYLKSCQYPLYRFSFSERHQLHDNAVAPTVNVLPKFCFLIISRKRSYSSNRKSDANLVVVARTSCRCRVPRGHDEAVSTAR